MKEKDFRTQPQTPPPSHSAQLSSIVEKLTAVIKSSADLNRSVSQNTETLLMRSGELSEQVASMASRLAEHEAATDKTRKDLEVALKAPFDYGMALNKTSRANVLIYVERTPIAIKLAGVAMVAGGALVAAVYEYIAARGHL